MKEKNLLLNRKLDSRCRCREKILISPSILRICNFPDTVAGITGLRADPYLPQPSYITFTFVHLANDVIQNRWKCAHYTFRQIYKSSHRRLLSMNREMEFRMMKENVQTLMKRLKQWTNINILDRIKSIKNSNLSLQNCNACADRFDE